MGWGASWQERQIMGQWSPLEQQQHMNCLELEAVCLAICHWGPHWFQQTVCVYCDKSTAVAYIRKQQGTHSLSLFHKTLELFQLLDKFAIILVHTLLQGACNMTADAMSRINSPTPTERRLPLGTLNSLLCFQDSADGHIRNSGKQGDTDLRFTLPVQQCWGGRRPFHIVGWLRTDLYISPAPCNLSQDGDPHSIAASVTAMASASVTTKCTTHIPLLDVDLFHFIPNHRRPQYHRDPHLLDLTVWLSSGTSSDNITSPSPWWTWQPIHWEILQAMFTILNGNHSYLRPTPEELRPKIFLLSYFGGIFGTFIQSEQTG